MQNETCQGEGRLVLPLHHLAPMAAVSPGETCDAGQVINWPLKSTDRLHSSHASAQETALRLQLMDDKCCAEAKPAGLDLSIWVACIPFTEKLEYLCASCSGSVSLCQAVLELPQSFTQPEMCKLTNSAITPSVMLTEWQSYLKKGNIPVDIQSCSECSSAEAHTAR